LEARLRLTLEAAEIEQAITELQIYRNALEKIITSGTDEQCDKLVAHLTAFDGGPKYIEGSQN
jgi:hypothetical protein